MLDPEIIMGVKSVEPIFEPGDFSDSEYRTYRPLIAWFDEQFMAEIRKLADAIEAFETVVEEARQRIAPPFPTDAEGHAIWPLYNPNRCLERP